MRDDTAAATACAAAAAASCALTLERDEMYLGDVTFSEYRRPRTGPLLRLTALLLVLTGGLAGCNAGKSWKDPGPRETFELFLTLWHRGEDAEAFAIVSPEDRAVLEAPRDALEGRVPQEALPEAHALLAVATVDSPYAIARIDTGSSLDEEPVEGQRVTLTLNYEDGRTGTATMVWGGDRWYVDLPTTDAPSAG